MSETTGSEMKYKQNIQTAREKIISRKYLFVFTICFEHEVFLFCFYSHL